MPMKSLLAEHLHSNASELNLDFCNVTVYYSGVSSKRVFDSYAIADAAASRAAWSENLGGEQCVERWQFSREVQSYLQRDF
jgi:hypothetical protein